MPWSPDLPFVRRVRAAVFGIALGGGLLVSACAPEAIVLESAPADRLAFSTVFNEADVVRLIESDLSCLFRVGLLPNESSSLGKFEEVVAAKLAGDDARAESEADNLIRFINLKYSQYTGPAQVNCGPPTNEVVLIADLKDRVVARINAFVSLDGNICEIPQGSPATFCSTGPVGDEEKALVYFPAAIFSELTYVLIEKNPPGFDRLQNLGLDEYPTYVRVLTAPRRDFSDEPLKPLVVVCFNEAVVPNNAAVRERLLLGHKRSSDSKFELMPTPDYGAYGGAVLEDVQQFCGLDPLASQGMFPSSNVFGRAANSVVNFFAPQPLHAAFASFRGVGGSAEEFSEFGAVDRGLTGKGGVGGSAEEFSRVEPGLASSLGTTADAVDSYIGVAGVDRGVDVASRLPSVIVESPGGNPVPGVVVTFSVSDPVKPAASPRAPSNAALCGSATAVTGTDGVARPACVDFGTTAGFKNLKATFDPSKVDENACIIDPVSGACATATTSINHLLETVAGAPTTIIADNPVGGDFGGGFPVGGVLAPRVKVTDAFSNTVTGAAVLWRLSDPTRGSVTPAANTTEFGLASASWTLGAGTNGLNAYLGDLSGQPATFTAESFASLSCEAGSQTRKANLGSYVASAGGYVGYFSMRPELAARMRKLTLQMSVTGQSSGTGNYQAEVTVFRGNIADSIRIATGTQSNPSGIQLAGDNGNAQPVEFTLTPTNATAPLAGNNNFVVFRVRVKAPATRTIQLWYNSRPAAGTTCASSILYVPGITSGFETTAARNKIPGLLLRLTN